MKAEFQWAATGFLSAALFVGGSASAAEAADPNLRFCAKAALFTEVYVESMIAKRSGKDSVPIAVKVLDAAFADKVDEATLRLLMPWAEMAARLPGYRPTTAGGFTAVNCMSLMQDASYVPVQKPELQPQVRFLLDVCEPLGSVRAVTACIRQGYDGLQKERVSED